MHLQVCRHLRPKFDMFKSAALVAKDTSACRNCILLTNRSTERKSRIWYFTFLALPVWPLCSQTAVLGAELGGGIGEKLLSLAPVFLRHVSDFTEMIAGGPTRFVTFFGYALQISLVIGGDVLMLIGHEGKNLPPGLRERLIATTQALNDVYGPQP